MDPARAATTLEPAAVILFDGVCNLCNGAVTFVIDRDPDGYFAFAPLQSETARAMLGPDDGLAGAPETIILVEDGRIYTHSAAALRIARRLSGAWPLLYGLILVPKPVRDGVYRWVARNRYRWFGRADSCRLPTPEEARRFL